MKECIVKNIKIGAGKPKICLPIMGKNDESIFAEFQSFEELKYDILELRIDFYQDILNSDKVLCLLEELRKKTSKPLLLTYRSQREGGNIQLTDQQYQELIQVVCASQCIDIIDIELMSGNVLVYQLVDIAHRNDVKVIMSYHNFEKTPSAADMMDNLEKMEILGADILKLAVMPCSHKDVIHLLNVTMEMSHKLDKPIVTMSMGQMGVISRITGELTGSAMTFACAKHASAPGQMHVNDIQTVLEAIHND